MPATDDEIRVAAEEFRISRERIDALRTQRDALVTDRSVIAEKIQNLNSQIDAEKLTATEKRVVLRDLLARP